MKPIRIEVNGLMVDVDGSAAALEEIPVYRLLRVGDTCVVDDGGVRRRGIVRNIICLSNGKTKFSVDLLEYCPLKDWDMYDGSQVSPVDELQCRLRLTAFDMILRKYEPQGQSLNVSLWGG